MSLDVFFAPRQLLPSHMTINEDREPENVRDK